MAVEEMVEEALSAGARLVTRRRDGELARMPEESSFTAPALLVDVPDDAALARSEVFGPAAGIFRFRTEKEALERANATEMGLAAYAVHRVARSRVARIGSAGSRDRGPQQSPAIRAFAPMGGVKQSGLGREGTRLGLEEFLEVKYLSIEV